MQEKLLSVGTALVAASPAATAADAESPAATAAAAESLALPAATAQQAGDMAIATFECVSRLGSLCLVSSAFRGPEVCQDVLPTTPPSQLANIIALGCGGSAADSGSTRGFCTSVWHAWFCVTASRRRCPDCLVCQSKQGQHISLHGPRVFGGGRGPSGGKRFRIDSLAIAFSTLLVARWFGRFSSFLGTDSLGKVISRSGREPSGGGGPCKSAVSFFRTGFGGPQPAPREHLAGCEGQQADLS